MEIIRCKSCGAPLSPRKIQCDYCGSFVKYSKTFFTPEVHSGTTTNLSRTIKYLNLARMEMYNKRIREYITRDDRDTIDTLHETYKYIWGNSCIKEKL